MLLPPTNTLTGVDLIPAFVPYLLLVVISLTLFAFSWNKSRSVKIIPFYLCIAGIIYIFELLIFIILYSYDYLPGVFKDRFYDSALGAVVSNGFIAPSACVFIAIFGLDFFWWILLVIAVFMGIEETFIYLGIYKHYWWKTIYTGIGFTNLFLMGKWLWRKINDSNHSYLYRLIMVYLINVSLQGSVMFFYILLFHQIEYRPGWFEDPSRDNIAFATLFVHIDSILFALVVTLRARWLWKAILITGLGCCYLWLIRMGILFTSGIWPVIILIGVQIVLLQMLNLLHRILYEKSDAHGHL